MLAGDMGLASVLPELLRYAQEKDDERAGALEALSAMASHGRTHWAWRLGRRGGDEEDSERTDRVRRIARPMLPEIHKALAKGDSALRCRLLMLLGFLQDQEAIPVLLKHAKDSSADVRASAVHGLVGLKAPGLAATLAPILKKIPEHARIPVLQEIGWSGDRGHIPALAEQLSDGSPVVVGHSLIALARLKSAEHLPEIRRHLESPNSNLRWFAVQAIGAWGDPREAPALLKRLEDDDIEVGWAAIDALGELGSKEAVPELEKLVKAPLEKTRALAQKSLDRIGRDRK